MLRNRKNLRAGEDRLPDALVLAVLLDGRLERHAASDLGLNPLLVPVIVLTPHAERVGCLPDVAVAVIVAERVDVAGAVVVVAVAVSLVLVVVDEDEVDLNRISIGCRVKILDIEYKEEMEFKIVGSTEANSLDGKISNEAPLGKALIGAKVGQKVSVDCPAGIIKYKVLEIQRAN